MRIEFCFHVTGERDTFGLVDWPHVPREGESLRFNGKDWIVRSVTYNLDDHPPEQLISAGPQVCVLATRS